MAFKKLESQNRSEYVYTQIIDAIKSGDYRAGDKLPNETEIASLAGVSRASVREALSALRLAGIVETKKGNGTYVKQTYNKIEDYNFSGFDYRENTFELLEARKIFEPAISVLAMENLDDEYHHKIETSLSDMERYIASRNFDAFHQANKLFHRYIIELTRNTEIIRYMTSLLNVFTDSELGVKFRQQYLTDQTYLQNTIKIHQEIFASLVSKDRDKLQAAWKKHNESVETQLLGI